VSTMAPMPSASVDERSYRGLWWDEHGRRQDAEHQRDQARAEARRLRRLLVPRLAWAAGGIAVGVGGATLAMRMAGL